MSMIKIGNVYEITKNWMNIAGNKTISYYFDLIQPGEKFEIIGLDNNNRCIGIKHINSGRIYDARRHANINCIFSDIDITNGSIKLIDTPLRQMMQKALILDKINNLQDQINELKTMVDSL